MATVLDRPTYRELLINGEPHPIKNADEAASIQCAIDELIEKGHLLPAEEEYLALLGSLILSWEEGQYETPELTIPEILHALIEDNGLRQADLVGPVFPTSGIASEIFSGKRNLTYNYVDKLAAFFHVSPAIFFRAP
jgi:HTH-type transcriptional regulator/antitoxin HigA